MFVLLLGLLLGAYMGQGPRWHALPIILGLLVGVFGIEYGEGRHMLTTERSNDDSKTSDSSPWNMPGAYQVGEREARVRRASGGSFTVYIKYPKDVDQGNTGVALPVVVFFNGFQSRYSWYSRMLQGVASWGFVAVQYQLPALSLINVKDELDRYYDPLMRWIEASDGLVGEVPGMDAVEAVVSAGHSRGGKVASLVFTLTDYSYPIQAAWLIDPVDSSMFAPISENNPSAVASLRKSGKKIGVAGASVLSSCNPVEGNYEKFFAAGAAGSWEIVMNGTSHSQFADGGAATNAVQDGLCGRGNATRAYIADTMATSMLSWFVDNGVELPHEDNGTLIVTWFKAGAMVQQSLDRLTFTQKA